jgi:outer membrane protein assembly factor BamD
MLPADFRPLIRGAILLSLLGLIAACSSDGEEPTIEQTELAFYESANSSLRASNYQVAVTKLQQLEARFPFGRYAEQAQLEIIYAYYKSVQPEAARNAADRFIRLHPQHANEDYAYYLRGMASFEEDSNFLDRFLPTDPSKRDPGAARQSFSDFAQLISRFPESKYAPDAQKRMIYLRNLLAAYEIHVARYYIQREAYIAAANRGRYVFENFQYSPSVADGLAVMVEAYMNLDMQNMARDALMVLVANYPDHSSLDKSGNFVLDKATKNSEKSWLNIVSFGLFG